MFLCAGVVGCGIALVGGGRSVDPTSISTTTAMDNLARGGEGLGLGVARSEPYVSTYTVQHMIGDLHGVFTAIGDVFYA